MPVALPIMTATGSGGAGAVTASGRAGSATGAAGVGVTLAGRVAQPARNKANPAAIEARITRSGAP